MVFICYHPSGSQKEGLGRALITILANGLLAMELNYMEVNKISVYITLNPIITLGAMGLLEAAEVTRIAHEKFTTLSLPGAAIVFGGAILVIASKRKK